MSLDDSIILDVLAYSRERHAGAPLHSEVLAREQTPACEIEACVWGNSFWEPSHNWGADLRCRGCCLSLAASMNHRALALRWPTADNQHRYGEQPLFHAADMARAAQLVAS